jgi:hypothetical protein
MSTPRRAWTSCRCSGADSLRDVGDIEDPSSPARVAAEIAPVIDRLRLAVAGAVRERAPELAQRIGIPIVAGPILGMLRNTMPNRVVEIDDVVEVFVYMPAEQIRSGVDQLIAADALAAVDGKGVALTDRGRGAVLEMFGSMQVFVDQLWEGCDEAVAATFPLAEVVCGAVAATGGASVRVVAPPYDPPGASPALRLIERLTPLRFHRFDAHARAWREEGLTAAEIQQLDAGEQRDRIERRTNELAAAPYAALNPAERLALIHGLASLPGGGV